MDSARSTVTYQNYMKPKLGLVDSCDRDWNEASAPRTRANKARLVVADLIIFIPTEKT